jgi:predicted benzoate:H+ symporter BenE
MKSLMKWLVGLYIVLGIITMIFQIYYRYPICSGAAGCGLSSAKGVVWSVIWPAYWAIQWNWLKL